MNKRLLLSFVAILTFFFATAQQRLVLVEEFTNASCGPCAAFNPSFHKAIDANEGKVVVLKYQVNYPGFDPMNKDNNTEAMNRHSYYGVSGVPAPTFDGKLLSPYTLAAQQATYDAAYNKPSSYTMTTTHTLNATYDSATITIKVKNISGKEITEANQKLHVAIIEKEISFPKAPGTNGEKVFHSVMRKMLPNDKGTNLPASIKIDEELTFTFNVALPAYWYNLSEIGVVAFVQNNTTKVVNQASISEPLPISGSLFIDVASKSKSELPTGPCATEITPKVEVTNNYDNEVSSFDAYYLLNNKKSAVINWTGKLAKGESAIVSFPVVNADAGKNNTFQAGVEKINGGAKIDFSKLNNVSESATIRVIPTAAKASLNATMEGAIGSVPTSVATIMSANASAENFLYLVDQAVTTAANAPDKLGGFGNSKSSLRFRFAAMPTEGELLGLAFHKISMKNLKDSKLKFDYAYSEFTYQGQTFSERMEVLVSADCGKTYKTVFDKEGADLATNSGPISKVFYPLKTDWKAEEIDLKEFDGKEEVIVYFKGTNDYGNNFYLDNVKIEGSIIGVAENILEGATMEVNPNPATDYTLINLNFNEATAASVKVFDITGKQIATLASNQNFSSGNHFVRWDINEAQGVFIVKVETAKGQITKRLTIVR